MPAALSSSELLKELEELADRIGSVPRVVDLRKEGKYSPTAYYNHFESWNIALREAGLEPNEESVETVCGNCGGSIRMPKYRVEKQHNVFCGQDCEIAWRIDYYKGENNPRWTDRVTIKCDYCGENAKREKFTTLDKEVMFCSRECLRNWQANNYTGEGNPNWNGGAAKFNTYGPCWDSVREEVIEDQDGKCRVCMIHRTECTTDLHVHHVTPVTEFLDAEDRVNWEAANRRENLVGLCPGCHRKWEGLPVLPKNT